MSTLDAGGVSLPLLEGWEGEIDEGGRLADGAIRRVRAHLANFPLPPERGDYGSGAVERMRPGDVLVVLLELDPASAGRPLFQGGALPRVLAPRDFHRDMLQRRLDGQGGAQHFFSEAGRAFCLYVVVGSHIDRADVLPQVNRVLSGIRILP